MENRKILSKNYRPKVDEIYQSITLVPNFNSTAMQRFVDILSYGLATIGIVLLFLSISNYDLFGFAALSLLAAGGLAIIPAE